MAFTDRRPQLHQILEELLGSENVYFQPPESRRLTYPCVVYSRENGDIQFADNRAYTYEMRYQITYIDEDPDSDFHIRLISRFPKCTYDRHYTADNLNHEVFNLYY